MIEPDNVTGEPMLVVLGLTRSEIVVVVINTLKVALRVTALLGIVKTQGLAEHEIPF